MIKILLHGAMGAMGKNVVEAVKNDPSFVISAGVDREDHLDDPTLGFPVYADFSKLTEDFDVVIDFSTAAAVGRLLDYIEKTRKPLVLCTTGLENEMIQRVERLSETVPILRSANMSVGVNLLLDLVKTAAETLYSRGFDIEIVEQHHHRKLDAPSGTALALADAVNDALDQKLTYVYGRSDRHTARPHEEIGISSVRGGTISGIHDVIFAGDDEVITLSHTAYSRLIFAKGALTAAAFLKDQKPGLYDMHDALR